MIPNSTPDQRPLVASHYESGVTSEGTAAQRIAGTTTVAPGITPRLGATVDPLGSAEQGDSQ